MKHLRPLFASGVTALALLAAGPVLSATPEELDSLYEALGTPELLDILREEGMAQSEELRDDMFPGRGGAGWSRLVSEIYDTDRMGEIFRDGFNSELQDADIAPLLTFFSSPLGEEIVSLELTGRRALLDADIEDAAIASVAPLREEDAARYGLIDGFVEANDLIEYNVMGALNSSFAFMRGLSDGGGFDLPEADILRDVWAQEPDIRDDTEAWIYGYLAMAYEPLSDDELERYTDLTVSPAGRDLNRALFSAFDSLFNDVSYSLGRGASTFMVGEDL